MAETLSKRLRDYCNIIDQLGHPPLASLLAEAAMELEALRKRCEAVEADAERLDWLAYHSASIRFDHITGEAYLLGAYHMRNAVVDDRKRFPRFREAIDQAIAAAQEPSHG